MAVDTESIQTLLKQRRELRNCLSDLRSEIGALNLKAETIVSKTESDGSGEEMPRNEKGGPLLPTQGAVSEPKLTDIVEPEAGIAMPDVEAKMKGEDQAEPTLSVSSSPVANEQETVERDVIEKQVNVQGTIDMPGKEILKKFDNIDDESLYYRAKLLSDYFSNHPSPVANEVLIRLDRAIKSLNKTDPSTDKKKDVAELRDVYREVSSKSYEKLGINGATLVDSRGGIGLLWGVPLFIAGLVLVLFPLILLLRSLAERMFVADFAVELSYILTASAGFLWGCVGALSYIAWRAGTRAKKGSYRKGSSNDVALRAVLGGVLGVIVFLCAVPFMPLDGIVPDMSIGLVSFFIGILSSILFVILYGLIASISRKIK